jgi:hypothetical protein
MRRKFIHLAVAVMATCCIPLFASCKKPTSGQHTSEYRKGQSGATSSTIEKETSLDSPKDEKK